MPVSIQKPATAADSPAEHGIRRPRAGRRDAVVLGISLAALVLAAIGAIGPSESQRATYSWPPLELPSAAPASQWYSPLLLIRRTPASLDANVPCSGVVPLPRAANPLTILATSRRPKRTAGLLIQRAPDGRIAFSVGGDTLAAVDADGGGGRTCLLRLQVEGDRWTLDSPAGKRLTGFLTERPIVSGIFTGLDLRRGARPSIALTTETFGTRPRAHQRAAWILATLAALAAILALAARRPGRLRPGRLGAFAGRLVRSLRPPDLLVCVLLVVWWVIGPAYYDDGWVKVRQTNYELSGGFSNYYSSYGVNLPLDYWLEWLQHWVVERSDTVLVLRAPALLLLAATWIVCRWILGRVLRDSATTGRGAQWALAVAFSLNALAWDVTLRPEPAIALLATGALACAVRFVERPSAAPIAAGGILVALGVTAHPAGLVTAAPLLVIAPRFVRWARSSGWVGPAALATGVLALGLVLLAVGSDVPQRIADGRGIRDYGDAGRSWREELERYVLSGASSLRRESVALMVVAAIAYLVRRSRTERPLLDLPAAGLALGLVLMIPTPSKWIWHFGVFAGLAAVAVAAEYARLREQGSSRWSLTPFLAAGALLLVGGWSLWPRAGWGDFDLRTLDWVIGLEDRVTLVKLHAAFFAAALITVFAIEVLRPGQRPFRRASWSGLPWLVPLAVLPVIGFTVAMLTLDAAKTPAWTLTRQNLESLRGTSGCGLADDTTVTAPASLEPLRPAQGSRVPPAVGSWTPQAPLPSLDRFTLVAGGRSSVLATPWYRIPPDSDRVGFFVPAQADEGDEAVEARWGRMVAGRVQPLSAPVQARTLPRGSCYESGAVRRLPGGRRAFHLRRIGRQGGEGWAIEGAGYVDETEFDRITNGAAALPAPEGAGFDPATLPTCETGAAPRVVPSGEPIAPGRSLAAGGPRGDRVTVPSADTQRPRTIAWTFLPEGRLPERPSDAELVQLVLRSATSPPRAVAATGAVAYRTTSLRQLFATETAPPLLTPNLVPLMPCRRLPRLAGGAVEVPSVVVSRSGLWPIELETAPFHGILDLYSLRDLSVGDTAVEPERMHVYWVDRNIPGAAVASVERLAAGEPPRAINTAARS